MNLITPEEHPFAQFVRILGKGKRGARGLTRDEAREAATISYLDGTGTSRANFDERLSVLGAMNVMRIMGIFARLVTRDKKPKYDSFQPRLRGLLNDTLSHPSLTEARDFVTAVAPHLLVPA